MPASRRALSVDHPIVITFLIFAVIAFMAQAAPFLKPLALAVLLSFALAPLAGFLERRGLPRALAVILTILLALGVLGGVTYKVGEQLTTLAADMPRYEEHIKKKLSWLKPQQQNVLNRLTQVGRDVARSFDTAAESPGVQEVKLVTQPAYGQWLQAAAGPYLETLGVVSFVLILVLFMLNSREDLSDRIIRLFGLSRLSVTTRTMEEAGQRISRYLGMFSLVNSCLGLMIGLGLWAIGMPYPLVWGVLFALLRFIPYVGPAAAFVLPLTFSFAFFEGWREPLLVVALFGSLELVANSFLEPVIYGRTTGVSALGLLVAAMFWTWLWGALGLLLSTPLTVCLAVAGKYVPGLGCFAILLGEEAPLEPDVRFYQRLLAFDQDGAEAIFDNALKQEPREAVFDQLLIPTLARAQRDRTRDDIDEREQTFVWQVVGEVIDDLEETSALDANAATTAPGEGPDAFWGLTAADSPVLRVLGIPTGDHADLLVLRMLAQLLRAEPGIVLTILPDQESPLKLADHVAQADPDLLLLSHLPPTGSTVARYLVRRLRARFASLPIVVGRWRDTGDNGVAERLTRVGATRVVVRVSEARDLIVNKYLPQHANEPEEAATA